MECCVCPTPSSYSTLHSTLDLVGKQVQFAQEDAERNLSANIECTSETAVVALHIVSGAK